MYKTKMLKKNYEFKNVLSKGKYYSEKYIEAVIINNKTKNNFIGIAVNSKVGNAVQRNRIKRLIRESYKAIEERIISGQTIVFLWKKSKKSEEADFHKIHEDVSNIVDRAGLFIKDEKYND